MDGANRKYIQEGIPHISKCLFENAADVLDGAEIVIIGNGDKNYSSILAGANDNVQILDLVRLKDGGVLESRKNYTGICW